MYTDTIGSRIRFARKQCGLKLRQVAKACGISIPAVSQWERDDTVPSSKYLIVLEQLTGFSPNWILTGRGPMPNQPHDAFALAAQAVDAVLQQSTDIQLTKKAYDRLVTYVAYKASQGIELDHKSICELVELFA